MAITSNTTQINQAVAAVGKREQLTEKQEKFLQLYIDNNFQDAKQCAIAAGYTPASAITAVRSLKNEIIELAEMMLVEHAPTAARTVVDIMTSEDGVAQAANKMDAAKTLLDRIGLGKKEKLDVNHNVSGGLFILPAKAPIKDVN